MISANISLQLIVEHELNYKLYFLDIPTFLHFDLEIGI